MLPLQQLIVSGGPGGELVLGRRFDLFSRIAIDYAVLGQRQEASATGAQALEFPADPSTFRNSPLGFSLHIGLQLRFNLFDPGGPNGSIETQRGDDNFDDDDV